MTIEFDDFTGYDTTKADVGEWTSVARGTTKLRFRVRFRDIHTQAAEAEFKRARAPFAKDIAAGVYDETGWATIALAYVYLTEWEGVTAKGKPVKFAPDVAFQFLRVENNKWMVGELMAFAINANNFAPDIDVSADEATKN